MDDLLREFLTETNEHIDVIDVELVRFEREPNNAKILDRIFRLVHTIKGTCGFLNLPRLEALTHAAEALMDRFRAGAPVTSEAVTLILSTIDRIKLLLASLERLQAEEPGNDEDLIWMLDRMADTVDTVDPVAPPDEAIPAAFYEKAAAILAKNVAFATAAARDPSPSDGDRADGRGADRTIRVHLDTLEQLMTMVSELVLTRNQLLEIARRSEDGEFLAPLQRLSNVTAELQESVMKTRMQPIGNAWQKLPRIVRDLSTELGKPVEFEMHGAQTELDRQVLDLIRDPLIHMVRNACDHGLEMPEQRRAAGKPDKGLLRLSAWHQGGQIIVELADDGRGLDSDRIREAVLLRGLAAASDVERMSEAQVQQFIFSPGLSTALQVTNVSGRGVGLDVVRSNIGQIGGTIDVKSVRGRSTVFTIKIPLTLAIVASLIVEAGGDRFAIPQVAVVELIRVGGNSGHRVEYIRDAAMLRLRKSLLPLIRLDTVLGLRPAGRMGETDAGFVVVTQVGSRTFGIVVDRIFHTEEIVVKPMSNRLRSIAVFSGNTILGDGAIVMIIDPTGVAEMVGDHAGPQVPSVAPDHGAGPDEAASTEPLLVFRAGSRQPKAIPLTLITRLEEVDAGTIETSDGRPVIQYRGQLMPLVPVNEETRLRRNGLQPLLVISEEGRSMALIVDEIMDIVEERLDVELTSGRPGVLGAAVIGGRATDVLDVAYFLPLAFQDWASWKESRSRRRRRVLLVDDAPFFRNMLAPVLKAAGYAVTCVASAEGALALFGEGAAFDAVVTDIDMPGMDGFTLATVLRRDPRMAAVPIIGLLLSVSADMITRGREAGFHDFVAKFDTHGLVAALGARAASRGQAA